MKSQPAVFLLAATATAIALGGCGGGGAPPSTIAPVGVSTPIPTSTPTATPTPAPAPTVPSLNVVSVTPDISSVKVQVSPYTGAADYRIYKVASPTVVKYAGMLHTYDAYGNHLSGVVNTELEANGLQPGQTADYIVEAVDALGPIGSVEGTPLSYYENYAAPGSTFPLGAFVAPMPGPGQDEQSTADGNTSTNGQGTVSAAPEVLARSQPFTVTALTTPALPTASASQVFFDTFPDSEGASISRTSVDASANSGGVNGRYANGNETFSMGNWAIRYSNADILNSAPFIMKHHFMDVLFDGGTPGSNAPPGQSWSWMSLTPNTAANFSGAILHVTMEVDCDQHLRRYMAIGIEPHGDPIVSYEGLDNGSPINLNVDSQGNPVNLGVDILFGPGSVAMQQAIGGTHTDGSNPPDGKIASNTQEIIGPPSSNDPLIANPQSQQAHGIDDRCREDVFLADTSPKTEYALYQDGKSVVSGGAASSTLNPLAKTLNWTGSVDVNFYHVIYHTDLEHQEINQYTPWYTFWLNTVQDSDERHWNNMGYEVLPMSELNNLASHAQPAKTQTPVFTATALAKVLPVEDGEGTSRAICAAR